MGINPGMAFTDGDWFDMLRHRGRERVFPSQEKHREEDTDAARNGSYAFGVRRKQAA